MSVNGPPASTSKSSPVSSRRGRGARRRLRRRPAARIAAGDKQVDGRGLELSQRGVNECVARGLSVIQGDADTDLDFYPDKGFDFVVLSQTLQATRNPKLVLDELLRIGDRAIVSFPNFGHWRVRCRCSFKGRMPVTNDLPYSWYDTPNIHFCTIRDFVNLCDELGAHGRKGDRARRQRPEDRPLDALVVLEFLRPAGGVPAEAMIAMHLFRRHATTVEIPPDILSGIRVGILVCTSPRSGSNHLAGLMASAGLGYPLEWFWRPPLAGSAGLSSRPPRAASACVDGRAIFFRSLRSQTFREPIRSSSQDIEPARKPSKSTVCAPDAH